MGQLNSSSHIGDRGFHTFGFFSHGSITGEVRSNIREECIYIVQDIAASGQTLVEEYSGKVMRRKYADIFANWKHGFIVREKESNSPVFVYEGPIPDRVFQILSTQTVH